MFLPVAEHGLSLPPLPSNEPVQDYAPGSSERVAIERELQRMAKDVVDMPLIIGGWEVRTGRTEPAVMPHDYRHVLGHAHLAGRGEAAIVAAVMVLA